MTYGSVVAVGRVVWRVAGSMGVLHAGEIADGDAVVVDSAVGAGGVVSGSTTGSLRTDESAGVMSSSAEDGSHDLSPTGLHGGGCTAEVTGACSKGMHIVIVGGGGSGGGVAFRDGVDDGVVVNIVVVEGPALVGGGLVGVGMIGGEGAIVIIGWVGCIFVNAGSDWDKRGGVFLSTLSVFICSAWKQKQKQKVRIAKE